MGTIISSGILVSGILILRKLFVGKISRRLQYSVWLSLPVLLVLSSFVHFYVAVPNLTHSENSRLKAIGQALNRQASEEMKQKQPTDNSDESSETTYGRGTSFADLVTASGIFVYDNAKIIPADIDKIKTKGLLLTILKTARYAVTCLLLLYIAIKNLVFAYSLHRSRRLYKKDSETGMNVYTVPRKEAPFLFFTGIYLSDESIANEAYTRYMILHEYCHFRQGDMIWNVVKYVFCAIYWFDPFVWLALYFVNKDCELACDEAVITMIGEEKREDYGMSLLTLIGRKQVYRGFFMESSMRSRRNFIKERIHMLTLPCSRNKITTVIICFAILMISGCSLIRPYEKQTEPAMASNKYEVKAIDKINAQAASDDDTTLDKEETQETAANAISDYDDFSNPYCNAVKRYKDTLYFSGREGLNSINIKTHEFKGILDGGYLLGNISDGYLYFIKRPDIPGPDKAGIGRVDLSSGEAQVFIPWIEELWLCNNVFGDGNIIYIETGGQCKAYRIDGDTAAELSKEYNIIYNAVNQFDLSSEGAYGINFGFINSIFDFSKFTLINSEANELYICDTDTMQVVKKENCLSDGLICDKGVVYTDMDGDIILCPMDEIDKDIVIYSAKEYGYGLQGSTYSKHGLYAVKGNKDAFEWKLISWQGNSNEAVETYDMDTDIYSGFSAFDDGTAYIGMRGWTFTFVWEEFGTGGERTVIEFNPGERSYEIRVIESSSGHTIEVIGGSTYTYTIDDSDSNVDYTVDSGSMDFMPAEIID